MKKAKQITTRDGVGLARALGMSSCDGHRWELRHQLVSKIIKAIEKEKLTHAVLARKAGTSRTRITSIVNWNIDNVSTDLLLRITECLGYRVRVTITHNKLAA